jgi:hypothetical protein
LDGVGGVALSANDAVGTPRATAARMMRANRFM